MFDVKSKPDEENEAKILKPATSHSDIHIYVKWLNRGFISTNLFSPSSLQRWNLELIGWFGDAMMGMPPLFKYQITRCKVFGPSTWLSYCRTKWETHLIDLVQQIGGHYMVISPKFPWYPILYLQKVHLRGSSMHSPPRTQPRMQGCHILSAIAVI